MHKAVIIGGSAGSFSILFKVFRVLKEGFHFPIFITVHRLRSSNHSIFEELDINPKIIIKEAVHGEQIKDGIVYIAPANRHLLFESSSKIFLGDGPPVNYSRPSIDVSMKSAAHVFGKDLIGILLTGANADGASGLLNISKHGGMTIVEDPKTAEIPIMPKAAVDSFQPSSILSAEKIISFIEKLSKAE